MSASQREANFSLEPALALDFVEIPRLSTGKIGRVLAGPIFGIHERREHRQYTRREHRARQGRRSQHRYYLTDAVPPARAGQNIVKIIAAVSFAILGRLEIAIVGITGK